MELILKLSLGLEGRVIYIVARMLNIKQKTRIIIQE